MIISPYETRHGSALRHKHIHSNLMTEILRGSPQTVLLNVEGGLRNTYSLTGAAKLTSEIPVFTQCISITHNHEVYLISDDRQASHSPRESLLNELNLKYTSIWIEGNTSTLKQSTAIAGRLFTNILTNAIIQKYGLSLQEMVFIRSACAVYYDNMYGKRENYQVVKSMMQFTQQSSTECENFLRRYPNIPTLAALAQTITEAENPALRSFNEISIYTIMSGIYYGLNAKENVAIGLEYIPRWLSMVSLVLQDAGFNRTIMGSAAKKLVEKDDAMVPFIKYILEK